MLEQLAEESVELAKAALKLARIVRHQNPTPVSYCDAFAALQEEIADVRVCLDVLTDATGPIDTADREAEKIQRWQTRLAEHINACGADATQDLKQTSQTNGEWLRTTGDESLAKWLVKLDRDAPCYCKHLDICCFDWSAIERLTPEEIEHTTTPSCKDCMLDWLHAERAGKEQAE